MKTGSGGSIRKAVLAVLLGPLLMPGTAMCQPADNDLQTVAFVRVTEPREQAFSMLIPKGWQTSGGIFRIDPTAGGGSGNAIDAKVDFTVAHPSGKAMIRFLPDMNYFDMRFSPAGQMGMFPTGSNYNGMLVTPWLTAQDFITAIVIPYAHPALTDYRLNDSRPSPELIRLSEKEDQYIGIPFTYDAGLADISYTENGTTYREILMAVTQDFGQLGAGLWKNRHTFLVRAPETEFEAMAPLFHVMIGSLQINMQWLIGEVRAQVQRGATSAEVLRKMQQMDQEISDAHAKSNAQISEDMFLNLTGQEEYLNPYTNKVETGSNEWDYRWTNSDNEVIYTNDVNYDPNRDQLINREDFKLTPIHRKK